MKKTVLLWFLILALLAGCTGPEKVPATSGDTWPIGTDGTTPPETTTTEPMPLETTPEATLPQVRQGTIADAPGTVSFYLGDQPFYCGQSVSALLSAQVIVEGDVEQLLAPGHYSQGIRLRLPDSQGKYEDNIYFVAVNPGDEPLPLKQCLIYSLTFNCEAGHRFALGEGDFTTGQTTEAQVLAAWGAPTLRHEGKNFVQLVYYRPFSSVQLVIREDGVNQVIAYHSAYLYPQEAEQTPPGDYLTSDALLLLSRHMDITPYLSGGKGEKRELELSIQIAGETIRMGVKCSALPEPWRSEYQNLWCELKAARYVYTRRPGMEGFLLANRTGEKVDSFYRTTVKGVYVFNPDYRNWYYDYSQLREFSYMGVTNKSTIEDVIGLLGSPYEVVASSGPGCCFAWLHYEAENQDTLRIKVDPVTNQIIEMRLEDYTYGLYR